MLWSRVGLLAFALLGLAGQTTSAQVPENQVETTDLQGVPFRRIGLGPAPLYLADGVSLEQAPRVLEAMQLAWQRVPGLLGLPLPTQAVAVLVFRDGDQLVSQSRQLLGPVVEPAAACFSESVGATRAIYCPAPSLRTRPQALAVVAHELTH